MVVGMQLGRLQRQDSEVVQNVHIWPLIAQHPQKYLVEGVDEHPVFAPMVVSGKLREMDKGVSRLDDCPDFTRGNGHAVFPR